MGKLIVIDGLDGSGKATQAGILLQWLTEHNYNAHKISFPAYESQSSAAVKMYLNGELGTDPEVLNPFMCSSFYALDRAIQYIIQNKAIFEQKDSVIVADRYISANVIHQGVKFKTAREREKFIKWIYQYETKYMGIPKEDITIFLEMPVWKSQELMTQRYKGDEERKDIHEANITYLEKCYKSSQSALKITNKLGYRWEKIACLDECGQLKSKESIFNGILNIVKTLL